MSQSNIDSEMSDSNIVVILVEEKLQKEYFKEWVIEAVTGHRHVLENSNVMTDSLLTVVWIQGSDYP